MKCQFKNVRGLKSAKVSPDEIIKVEADENYSIFYFSNGKRITLAKTLKQCEDIFEPYSFYRTHRSCIINLMHCRSFTNNEILLNNNMKAVLSRRRRSNFLMIFNDLAVKTIFTKNI
ncbi:LytTR family transcriptional regulator [Lacihabitans sp. LS3-19]|uniref:LytR/AlgR family response regulator transcription factor n=1 Tax=Lacihabitans sp. LS3-19 TaxID=2487335 RepID=UPI0020CBAA8D|nr:LytTR family DNA-binding domain-containing protein [Lacihabitans sp. LS3-19]MCP9770776.1 LytTR family transcriptional regulator [Lacihabitans sp. LS3-19]